MLKGYTNHKLVVKETASLFNVAEGDVELLINSIFNENILGYELKNGANVYLRSFGSFTQGNRRRALVKQKILAKRIRKKWKIRKDRNNVQKLSNVSTLITFVT